MGRKLYVKGFPSLSDFVASDPDRSSAIFRRFDRLSARNLLFLQSELAELEAKLDCLDEDDISASFDEKVGLRDWETFRSRAESGSPREVERMELALTIRTKLKEYKETLLLDSAILAMRRPSKQSHEAFHSYFWNQNDPGGSFPTLIGSSSALYDNRDDLVALVRRSDEDPLTSFLRKRFPQFFLTTHQDHQDNHTSSSAPSIAYISANRISIVVSAVNVLLAATFLFGAILNLYYIGSDTIRLGLIAGYTVAFSLCVGLLTNARRAEVFGACAAYAAVLVVFVSGNLGGSATPTASLGEQVTGLV